MSGTTGAGSTGIGPTSHNPTPGAVCTCPACLLAHRDDSNIASAYHNAGPLFSAPALAVPAAHSPAITAGYTGPTQDDEISYLTGINASGTAVATSFQTWNNNVPATYLTTSNASKWGGNGNNATDPNTFTATTLAGSAGGTIDYYFDPASNWTATEMTGFSSGLALWSAVANIQFVATTNAADAILTFKRGTDKSSFESGPNQLTTVPVGGTALGNQGSGVYISIDTSQYGWQHLGSFTDANGYDMSTIVHEEGHFMGLGHGGPYNGTANIATQQYSAFDQQLSSIMSYYTPETTGSPYAAYYPASGTAWNGGVETTWMPLDILAMQRLYGTPTAAQTPLSGGQTFGFNSNVAASINSFFNFNVNANPIVTLWDLGAGNTLDLSHYGSPATIDLRAGDYSSFDGMVNNMAIAAGTAIDSYVGTTGGNTVHANSDSDTITMTGSGNTVTLVGPQSDYMLTSAHGSTLVFTNTNTGAVDTITGAQNVQYDTACYAAGTPILTAEGERPVEALRPGDSVVCVLGQRMARIVWIGHRRIVFGVPGSEAARPIRVAAGAFGPDAPHSDVWLSPEHAVFTDGVLVPIRHLVNHSTIRPDDSVAAVTYFHIELAQHDVLLAAGLPAESWLDTGNRGMFANAAMADLHPAFMETEASVACAPLVVGGAALAAIRARLHEVAAGQGALVPAELVVTLGGVGRMAVLLPAGIGQIRLCSPAGICAPDRRRLGALVAGIAVDGVACDLVTLSGANGFHGAERHDGEMVRWTDGEAVLAVAAVDIDRRLTVDVAALPWAVAAAA